MGTFKVPVMYESHSRGTVVLYGQSHPTTAVVS